MPCTIHASVRLSAWDAGHPKQCMPVSKRIGTRPSSVLRISPIVISFVIVAIRLSLLGHVLFAMGIIGYPFADYNIGKGEENGNANGSDIHYG